MESAVFCILNITFFTLVFIMLYYKEYRNTYPLYALFLILIFYSPAVYYFLGGSSYRYFSEISFLKYMLYASLIFFINSIFLVAKNTRDVRPVKSNLLIWLKNEGINTWVVLYFLGITFVVLGYIAFYFERFPLVNLISSGQLTERPDIIGSIPHFYTLSTLMYFIFPSSYFFFFKKIKPVAVHLLCLSVIAVVLTIGGHKGVIAFFGVFLWYYGMNRKINYKFVAIVLVLLGAYAFTKGITSLDSNSVEYLLTSPFRRFFVTQGACMITRFHMLEINYVFDAAIPIKNQVCDVMYGGNGMGCSAPTYFVGDLIVQYGFFIATAMYMTLLLFIIWIIKNIDDLYPDNLFIKWNLFCFLFLIGMAEITFPSFLRMVLILFNVYFVAFLSGIRNSGRRSAMNCERK